MKQKICILLLLLSTVLPAFSQYVHESSSSYVWPEDPLVKQKLDQWQDLKFGMIIHWGLYAVPGIVESWSICPEDEAWISRDSTIAYSEYKKWYWGLINQFNPVKFDPSQWASSGKAAGMNYLVFTTKHHDGFCMFDTKETDFSIAKGAFKNNPKADVAKYVFQAFRDQGYMIGAYFSKPDWHSQDYWWDYFATPNRNNNYDIRKHAWKWERFKTFTYNQIQELMTNYGSIDILWLDGGWVRPSTKQEQNSRWSQDVDMPRIASMARKTQPGLLVVDRTVHGLYENYQTPEQAIPEKQQPFPWETCMTLGTDWGYVPNQPLKSSRTIVHKLIEIVAKGGSLLLGVGPSPEGLLPDGVVSHLQEIGKWTSKNGKAIYGTRITEHYNDGNAWFTQSKDGKKGYAMICVKEGDETPVTVKWSGNTPVKGSKMILLHTGKPVQWKKDGDSVVISIPKGLPTDLPALAFEFVRK